MKPLLQKISKGEQLLAYIALFLITRVLLINVFGGGPLLTLTRGGEVVDPVIRIFTVTGYLLAIGLMVSQWKTVKKMLPRDPLLIAFLAWMVLSVIWSVNPLSTLRRLPALAGSTALGAYLGVRYSTDGLAKFIARYVVIVAGLSLFLVITAPSISRYIEPRGEVWAGVFVHKNQLGFMMSFGFLLWVYASRAFGSFSRWFFLFAGGMLLWFSFSRGGQVIAFLMVLFYPYLKTLVQSRGNRQIVLFLLGLMAGGGIATWVVQNLPTILMWLGRDPSLTGRTLIWALVWKSIQKRFWIGYGFDAFWSAEGGALIDIWRIFLSFARWIPPHSHNGFLELWLHGGAIGVGLFLIHFILLLWTSLRRSLLWPFAFLLFLTLYSLLERTILAMTTPLVLLWIVYVALSIQTRIRRDHCESISTRDQPRPFPPLPVSIF